MIKTYKGNELEIPSYLDILNISYSTTDCNCNDDYCRCTEIEDLEIKSVNITKAIEYLSTIFLEDPTPIDRYLLERVFSYYKLYNPNFWRVNIDPGYYGEEIGDIEITTFEFFNNIWNKITDLPTDSDRIRFILDLEYNSILLQLKDAYFEVKEYSLSELNKREPSKKLPDYNYYFNKDTPIGIYRQDLFPIDGNHRLEYFKNKFTPLKKVLVIQAT